VRVVGLGQCASDRLHRRVVCLTCGENYAG